MGNCIITRPSKHVIIDYSTLVASSTSAVSKQLTYTATKNSIMYISKTNDNTGSIKINSKYVTERWRYSGFTLFLNPGDVVTAVHGDSGSQIVNYYVYAFKY